MGGGAPHLRSPAVPSPANIGRTGHAGRDSSHAVWQDRIALGRGPEQPDPGPRGGPLGDDGETQQGDRDRARAWIFASAPSDDGLDRRATTPGPLAALRPGARVFRPSSSFALRQFLIRDGRGTMLAQGMTEDIITALSKNLAG